MPKNYTRSVRPIRMRAAAFRVYANRADVAPGAGRAAGRERPQEPACSPCKILDRELFRAEDERLDGTRVSGGFVHVDAHGVHLDVALGNFEPSGKAVEEALDDAFLAHADDGIVRPGHARVGDESRALGEDV